jgi:hypothetical protein
MLDELGQVFNVVLAMERILRQHSRIDGEIVIEGKKSPEEHFKRKHHKSRSVPEWATKKGKLSFSDPWRPESSNLWGFE